MAMASPAAPLPPAGGVPDGVEPAPEWLCDIGAAERFASPEAIRGALLPEHVGEFDAAFDAALTAARQTLRLYQLRLVLQVWRRVASLTERDPDEYRGGARGGGRGTAGGAAKGWQRVMG